MYGVGQGGGQDHFRAAGGKEVLRGSRGQERRKPATRGTVPRPGSAAWAWLRGAVPGSLSQDQEGFGLGVHSAALLQALVALASQLTLLPLKQVIFPEKKREPAGPQPIWGSHVSYGKPGYHTRQNLAQRTYRMNELGAFLKGEKGRVYFCGYVLIKGNEK